MVQCNWRSVRLLKPLFTCLEKKCQKKTVFFRKGRSISRNSDFEPEIFGRLVKTAFNVCRGIFREKLSFAKIVFSAFFPDLSGKNFVVVVESAFHVSPKKMVAQKKLWKIYSCIKMFGFWAKIERAQGKHFSVGLTETAFYLSRGPFWNVNHDYKKNSEFWKKKTRTLC